MLFNTLLPESPPFPVRVFPCQLKMHSSRQSSIFFSFLSFPFLFRSLFLSFFYARARFRSSSHRIYFHALNAIGGTYSPVGRPVAP